MNYELEMSPNKVVTFLGKPNKEFTKADIIRYIKENGIKMINFMYPAGDGRLKTLNFVINNAAYQMPYSHAVNALMARASSRLSKQAVATYMYYPVSAQHSSTPLPRFQHYRCYAPISTKMAHHSKVPPRTPYAKHAKHSTMLQAWNFKQWES